jgi:hypothetical protein
MTKIISIALVILLNAPVLSAQKLSKFGADMGKKTVLGKEIRVPYTDVVSFYGYVKPGAAPDETKDGKKYYYVYLWIPAVAPEIGIRMLSPVPAGMEPADGDFHSPAYDANKADAKNYFDTWVTLERAVNILSVGDIKTNISKANWVRLGYNDDSKELLAQPSGSFYNSLLRITSTPGDPLKALTVGLYRIGFTTFKTGEVQGSFVAQVGAPVKLPGIVIAATAEGIVAAQQ